MAFRQFTFYLLLGVVIGVLCSQLIWILFELTLNTAAGHSPENALLPRILCWVATDSNYRERTQHLMETWGGRCDKFVIVQQGKKFPRSRMNNKSWTTAKYASEFIYANHLNEADWFLHADHDTYVVLENLRHRLLQYAPEKPFFIDFKYKNIHSLFDDFGYVMNRAAVRRFVEAGLNRYQRVCSRKAHNTIQAAISYRQIRMVSCMDKIGVSVGSSRDPRGCVLFASNTLEQRTDYCSKYPIAFRAYSKYHMYTLDFLINHFRLYEHHIINNTIGA